MRLDGLAGCRFPAINASENARLAGGILLYLPEHQSSFAVAKLAPWDAFDRETATDLWSLPLQDAPDWFPGTSSAAGLVAGAARVARLDVGRPGGPTMTQSWLMGALWPLAEGID